ncbi:SDR family NAD(P)-dependent oxidoreductase [Streptomyces sp. NPDC001851]|uniref:SDR family NAD(P)-dependent oxidoreductase n=1 Tax=Streptomyces sp. NPDC001851 TaxID=3154529 RepID=UPI0033325ADF
MTPTTHVRRTAVVTGGARGIGAAVARRLAGDGSAVGVTDLDEADGAEAVEAITEEFRRRAEQSIPVGHVAGGPVG